MSLCDDDEDDACGGGGGGGGAAASLTPAVCSLPALPPPGWCSGVDVVLPLY